MARRVRYAATVAARRDVTDLASLGKGRRVLVVNDTQEILDLFVDLLGGFGFEQVELMSYAPRELERIRELRPDLVILDLIFGDGEASGWQLLQKLRMDRTLADTPVIVCTADVRAAKEREGYLTEQGVTLVLKPFRVDQLEDAVRRACEQLDVPGVRAV
jgi:CheY-like chemotaxis protein